jgi:hypothetical protein
MALLRPEGEHSFGVAVVDLLQFDFVEYAAFEVGKKFGPRSNG